MFASRIIATLLTSHLAALEFESRVTGIIVEMELSEMCHSRESATIFSVIICREGSGLVGF